MDFPKKRGMSSIVATSLVITITILAGALIGTFVVPFVQKSLERSTECTNYEMYFSLESDTLGPLCYQNPSKNNYVVVSATNDKTLEKGIVGFQLLFIRIANKDDPGAAVSVKVQQSGASDVRLQLYEGGMKTAVLPKAGEIWVYSYNDGQRYDRVEISTIVGNGRVCERKADSAKIVACGNAQGRP